MMSALVEPFDFKNLPLAVDAVAPLWSPSAGDVLFKRFNVEYIVRNSIFENDYRFQLVDSEGTFLAASFFARKGDLCKADEWFSEGSKNFPDELKRASGMSRAYLGLMDKKTFSLMSGTDIKLSLFISRKAGCGSLLLDSVLSQLKSEGWKTLYLWTDCDCNWQWYKKHGYTLVEEAIYGPFSTAEEDYKTYIYRKSLQEMLQKNHNPGVAHVR